MARFDTSGFGLNVVHNDGQVSFQYAHLEKIYVNVRDNLQTGDLIGLLGTSGISDGAHIHWEAWETNGGSISLHDIPDVHVTSYSNPHGMTESRL